MKIGITERGDASIDYQWVNKLSTVNGAIIITKNITDRFIQTIIDCMNHGHKIIVHATCTGWGQSDFEPNVPDYRTQLSQFKKLIDAGFPADHCVLRMDPVFPTDNGLKRCTEVLQEFEKLDTGVSRIRISIYDEYRHVKERLKAKGYEPIYGTYFYASPNRMHNTAQTLSRFNYKFETCAEDILAQNYPDNFEQIGCVSQKDLKILGLQFVPNPNMPENGQNRHGCHCLTCKTELLTNKFRCPHQCIYCYWRDK